MMKFNLRSVRPDWTKKLSATLAKYKDQRAGYAGLPLPERTRLKSFYAQRVGRLAVGLEPDVKRELWPDLVALWDALDTIDLTGDKTWKQELSDWDKAARDLVEATP
jgi:hypothetical protein